MEFQYAIKTGTLDCAGTLNSLASSTGTWAATAGIHMYDGGHEVRGQGGHGAQCMLLFNDWRMAAMQDSDMNMVMLTHLGEGYRFAKTHWARYSLPGTVLHEAFDRSGGVTQEGWLQWWANTCVK